MTDQNCLFNDIYLEFDIFDFILDKSCNHY